MLGATSALVVGALLAACSGGSTDGETSGSTSGEPSGAIQVLTWRTDLVQDGTFDKYVAAFKAKYPKVTEVEVEGITDYEGEVKTRMNTDYQIERTATGYRLHVHARSLVRDLVVNADRIDPVAAVGDGLVTLAAGGSATVEITCRELPDPTVLLAPPVLRTANDLQRARTGRLPSAVTGT